GTGGSLVAAAVRLGVPDLVQGRAPGLRLPAPDLPQPDHRLQLRPGDQPRAAAGAVQQPGDLAVDGGAGTRGRLAGGVPAGADQLPGQPGRDVPDPGAADDPGAGQPGADLHHHGEARAARQLPGADPDLLGPLAAAGDLGAARLLQRAAARA